VARPGRAQRVRGSEDAVEVPQVVRACQRRELMDDDLRLRAGDGAEHRVAVEGIGDHGQRAGLPQALGLGGRPRHGDDLVALAQEQGHQPLPDRSGGTCDEDPHGPWDETGRGAVTCHAPAGTIVGEHMTDSTALHDLRPLAFSIAYRMLGSAAEAEDIAQEALLRAHRELAAGTEIAAPKAFLTAIATRLAIDHLRSARVRREAYVGPWLPEPLLTGGGADPAADPAADAQLADDLSLALLVVLERLGPVERAVFLLREAFDYPFDDIAAIVGRTPDNCRQIAVRARRHVEAGRPRFDPSREVREELADRFLAAAQEGDMEALLSMLADDAVFTGDGGGRAVAYPEPLVGADRVAHALRAIFRAGARLQGIAVARAEVNGQPGWVVREADGAVVVVMALDVVEGRVAAVRSIVNPDKLGHLGPVSDLARRPGSS
jgi:RNA polymerase sigma-70 factor (ECF subfamily)